MKITIEGKITPKGIIEYLVFNHKWLLIPIYFRLIWMLATLVWIFFWTGELSNEELIKTIGALDFAMVANLCKMIISGSYNSFVSKTHGFQGENISSGSLKVKMGTSLINVCSVLMLRLLLQSHIFSVQLTIFLVITFAGYMLAVINKMYAQAEDIESKTDRKDKKTLGKHLFKNTEDAA